MIEDLKADSQRWEAEREAASASRQTPNGTPSRDLGNMSRKSNTQLVQEYRSSMVHQARQYYGPTEPVPGVPSSYPAPATSNQQPASGAYGDMQYQSNLQYSTQHVPGYTTANGGLYQADPTYYVGAHLESTDRHGRGGVAQPTSVPRSSAQQQPSPYSSSAPTFHPGVPDNRSYYTSPPGQTAPYAQQTDPYYRGTYHHHGKPPAPYAMMHCV